MTDIKERTPIREMMKGIMKIMIKEEFYSVDRLAKDLDSNWRTIDNYCLILQDLGIVKIKLLGKTKVIALL